MDDSTAASEYMSLPKFLQNDPIQSRSLLFLPSEHKSNNKAIVSALKSLQERLEQLESMRDLYLSSARKEEQCQDCYCGREQRRRQEQETKKKVALFANNIHKFYSSKLPFIAGMSTSPSHSIIANCQQLLFLLKSKRLTRSADLDELSEIIESVAPLMDRGKEKSVLQTCLLEIRDSIDRNRREYIRASQHKTLESPSKFLRKMKHLTKNDVFWTYP